MKGRVTKQLRPDLDGCCLELAERFEESTTINFVSVQRCHMLRVHHVAEPENLDVALRRFWELE